ncbi:tetratricopeptide repeat protein [bacterium]|nr:tetratricopeptide repeat protein [bacterium]
MRKTFCILCLAAFLAGCAYFNTFYNARVYYNKGYEVVKKDKEGKADSNAKTHFQKSIEKSFTLVRDYPKSKYVDDALLLMGKSYYYREEYARAERKFFELPLNFPGSELVPEARLWHAKTKLAVEEYGDAESEFLELLKQDLPRAIRGEASYFLGNLYSKNKSYRKAIEALQVAATDGDEEFEAKALFSIGANYDSLGQYSDAAKAFKEAADANPSLELAFESQFRYGQMLKLTGREQEAIQLFEKLLSVERNRNRAPDMRLEIAECLARTGDFQGAVISYDDITREFPKSIHSAKAFYYLGRMYEQEKNDLDRALDNFTRAKSQSSRSVYSDSAEAKARDIMRYRALRQVVERGLRGEKGELRLELKEEEKDTLSFDRLYAMMDSSQNDSGRIQVLVRVGGQAFCDSILREPERIEYDRKFRRDLQPDDKPLVEWYEWYRDGRMPAEDDLLTEFNKLQRRLKSLEKADLAENPELKSFKVEELDKNLLLLGELYLFRFKQADSAMAQYDRIISLFPGSPYTPQALYNQAHIHLKLKSDSAAALAVYEGLVRDYPGTRHANAALRSMGRFGDQQALDSLSLALSEAEDMLFTGRDAEKAYRKYQEIYERNPSSRIAARAIYAMAWISENRLDRQEQAFALYDSLQRIFPESAFAVQSQIKVQRYKEEIEKQASRSASPDSAAVSFVPPDSLQADSLQADSLQAGLNEQKSDTTGITLPGSEPPGQRVPVRQRIQGDEPRERPLPEKPPREDRILPPGEAQPLPGEGEADSQNTGEPSGQPVQHQ